MTEDPSYAPAAIAPDGPAPTVASLREILIWSGAWAAGLLVGGMAVSLWSGLPTGGGWALLLMIAPALGAAVLFKFDDARVRLGLIALWAVCAFAACLVVGGLGGPGAAWLLAPVAAGVMLGRSEMMARAGAVALAAAGAVALVEIAGLGSPATLGAPGFGLGALAVASTLVGLAAALNMARRRERGARQGVEHEVRNLSALLEGQPHLLLLIEADGRVTTIRGQEPEGVTRADLAQGFPTVARLDDRAGIRDAMRLARETGSSKISFVPAAALERQMVADVKDFGRGRLAVLVRDASDDQARLDAAESARADAENLAAGKSLFLAGMSHELRTPLNAIMGFSDIMRARMFGDLPGKYGEYAELIHESGAHLLDLINDVLDMSKIEARRYELSFEWLDPREPVAAALRILRLQAHEAGVDLRAALPATTIEARADRRALKQMVLNLVSNALKFTPKGGSVTVSLAAKGEMLELSVADTGVGIARDDLERLGRPYEQAGDAGKRAQGTGLGLSLVRSFAELHGGEMNIESTLGEGTAVTLRLPVVRPQPSEPAGDNIVAFTPQR